MEQMQKQNDKEFLQLLTELERPEVQESLTALMRKLPELEKNIDTVGQVMQFGKAVFEDQTTLSKYDEVIRTYQLNLETITAIVTLMEKLPKLVQMIEQLENVIDFVTAVLKDEQSTHYLIQNAKEYGKPLLQKGQATLEIIQQVQAKVESNPNEHISIFSVMKWLKDPLIQQSLRYVQATLEVVRQKTT